MLDGGISTLACPVTKGPGRGGGQGEDLPRKGKQKTVLGRDEEETRIGDLNGERRREQGGGNIETNKQVF